MIVARNGRYLPKSGHDHGGTLRLPPSGPPLGLYPGELISYGGLHAAGV
jgi:hypothetical protein